MIKLIEEITLDDVKQAASFGNNKPRTDLDYYMVYPSGFDGIIPNETWTDKELSEVKLCCEWIDKFASKLKRVGVRAGTSYHLKHSVERNFGKYISNGSFIVAAIMRGYSVRLGESGVNCYFNMKINKIPAVKAND